MARSALNIEDRRLIRPTLRLKEDPADFVYGLEHAFPPHLQPNLEELRRAVGVAWDLHDERLNLSLGRNLAKLGILALPMDLIDVDAEDLSDFPSMFWGLGARILRTAKRILRTPNWYGVHLTNFSCGADSFIEHFYRHLLKTNTAPWPGCSRVWKPTATW